jgi:hypothetical protein
MRGGSDRHHVRGGTRKKGEGMEADDLLCSRNARPRKALVGRAQWKINQPPSLKRAPSSLEGPIFMRKVLVRLAHLRIDQSAPR